MDPLLRTDFGTDFSWGVSSAAFQVEGAHNSAGKGPSIWDQFTGIRGKIFQNQHARTACDFYHRYSQDLTLMSLMNIPHYRFSLSWSRLFPHGTGAVNKAGVNYYNRLIDFCLEVNIQPWITLYHWDLPLALERKGGWTNRDIVGWFSDYTSFCVRTFGDRVKNWMVLNEPMVFTGAGYFLGVHAPGRRGLSSFLPAAHHAALCQAEGARAAKAERAGIRIGTTFSCSAIEPRKKESAADAAAASRVNALLNRTFLEPLLGLGYPVRDLRLLQRLEPYIKVGDEQRLAFPMDFIGLQHYTREIVTHTYLTPYIQARIVKASERGVDRTMMDWEVHPESMYHMLRQFAEYKEIKEIIVTENGAAFPDVVEGNSVHDYKRKEYLQRYLDQVWRAKREGVPVKGYFVWSFTDNFEWAHGYDPRFGLVYIDFKTQQRIVKESGHWYSEFLRNEQGVNLLMDTPESRKAV